MKQEQILAEIQLIIDDILASYDFIEAWDGTYSRWKIRVAYYPLRILVHEKALGERKQRLIKDERCNDGYVVIRTLQTWQRVTNDRIAAIING